MPNSQVTTTKASPVVGVVRNEKIQKMFEERLGKRAGQFTTSLISVINGSKGIAECEPMTVIQAALTAASMDLPINQNLGFAYIVPYNNNKYVDGQWQKVKEAQFQMGYKGFIQLAQRSGLFKTINTTDVRETEVKSRDRMTGELKFQWIEDEEERNKTEIIGYLAYFELLNGFSKSLYMTKTDIEKHADQYSQAYRGSKKNTNKSSFDTPWSTNFDLMAQKTALKLLLSRFAPLSTEMQEAINADQSVDDGSERRYVDNSSDNMEHVKANAQKKADIVAAHQEAAENETVHNVTPKQTKESIDKIFKPEDADQTADEQAAAPAPTAKSVKERAAEFVQKGKAANAQKKEESEKGTQSSLIDDDKNS